MRTEAGRVVGSTRTDERSLDGRITAIFHSQQAVLGEEPGVLQVEWTYRRGYREDFDPDSRVRRVRGLRASGFSDRSYDVSAVADPWLGTEKAFVSVSDYLVRLSEDNDPERTEPTIARGIQAWMARTFGVDPFFHMQVRGVHSREYDPWGESTHLGVPLSVADQQQLYDEFVRYVYPVIEAELPLEVRNIIDTYPEDAPMRVLEDRDTA